MLKNAGEKLGAFIWGANGEQLTPEQVARRRERASMAQGRAGDTSPVGHWTQGAARVVDALGGVVNERRADRNEKSGMASADEFVANDPVLAGLLGGGGGSAPSMSTRSTPQGDTPISIGADTRAAIGAAPTGADDIRAGLIARGLPEHVADGFIMNFQDESGMDAGINEIEPLVPGSRGGFGLYQLTGPRRREYEAFAAQRGVSADSVDAQLDFLMEELQGSESSAAQSIMSTRTAGEAGAAIVNDFLRPSPEYRQQRASRYMGGGGMSSGGQAQPVTGGGSDVVGALTSAMSNPWVAEKYGPVIEQLMGQEQRRGDMQFQQQLKQSDPMYQAQLSQLTAPPPVDPMDAIELETAQFELDALKNTPAPAPGAPDTQKIYDPVTGQEQIVQWNGAEWTPLGGVAAPSGPMVSVENNMPGSDEFQEAFAKGDAAALAVISDSGMSAQRNIGRIDTLANLLENSPSGFGGAAALKAGEWGINIDGLNELQAAQAMISSLVPEQRQPGSGPMSDADLDLFKQSLPRIINQPGGNDMIVSTMRAIANYDAEGAAIVQQVRSGDLTRAEAFEALQARPHPMPDFKAGEDVGPASAATPEAAAPSSGLTADDLKYLGLE